MNPLTMSDNELKQYIDTVFYKYDKERNGTLSTLEMTSYLTELFELLGYGNVSISTEQAQQAIQMIDRNNDNKITKMELFLTFKQLGNSMVTDFGDVKIFMLGQGGFNTGGQQQGLGNGQNVQNTNSQGGWGGNGNGNYPYGNNASSNGLGYGQVPNQNQNTWGNNNVNNINKPTINTPGNQNGWNNPGNNLPPVYPNKGGQLPPTPKGGYKGSQTNQWGPQVPPQPQTWGQQQQARGSGANNQQQQYYHQARGSGAQVQNQTYAQQARGSGVGIEAQYPGYDIQQNYQNAQLSGNLVWANGNSQPLVWGIPGQRPGTPPSAAYTGYQQAPMMYYDPYSGGYMKVGKGNNEEERTGTVTAQN